MTWSSRIKAIGERANRLRREGVYTTEYVEWLSEYVKRGEAEQAEAERLIFEAEESAAHKFRAEPWLPKEAR